MNAIMLRLLPVLIAPWPGMALAQSVPPRPVVAEPVLAEALREDEGPRLRLRYVWPDLNPDAAADLARDLCRRDARVVLDGTGIAGQQGGDDPAADWEVIVSISDVPVPFGQSTPAAVQVFEGFSLSGGDCIWSDY